MLLFFCALNVNKTDIEEGEGTEIVKPIVEVTSEDVHDMYSGTT